MSQSIVFGLVAVLTSCFVAAQQPRYNVDAPALAVELLQAPSGARATWESLKGQAVLLDFWSTWCTGCVAEIPRLNAIAEKFRDKPVRFIYVTDEDRETVSRFLAKRPISGWVALDTHGAAFRAFGVEGRPLTAFIDAHGVLRGETNLELTESEVENLLAGTLLMTQSAEAEIPSVGAERNAPLPLFEVLIRPAIAETESGMSPGSTRQRGNVWEAWGLNLDVILSYSFLISQPRILVPMSYDKARYDVSVTLPDSSEESRRKMLKEAVESAFRIRAQIARRETDVFILRKRASAELEFKEYPNGRALGAIVSLAEQTLGRPVLDETGLHEKYDFVLAFPHNTGELIDSIQSLGLELIPERRSIDMLVVDQSAPTESVPIP
jgi:thiol-disulfide isomerase/thioredoxin